eukprot:6200085-Pleurochrysis_carterae.AAC.2
MEQESMLMTLIWWNLLTRSGANRQLQSAGAAYCSAAPSPTRHSAALFSSPPGGYAALHSVLCDPRTDAP